MRASAMRNPALNKAISKMSGRFTDRIEGISTRPILPLLVNLMTDSGHNQRQTRERRKYRGSRTTIFLWDSPTRYRISTQFHRSTTSQISRARLRMMTGMWLNQGKSDTEGSRRGISPQRGRAPHRTLTGFKMGSTLSKRHSLGLQH
jgi:hypothetical protein